VAIVRLVKPRIHPAFIAAGVAFLLLLAAAGVRSTPTMLILPLEREFHWSAATISLAIAINIVLFGLTGPFAAAFMERFGLRRTVVGSLTLLATAWALTTQATQPWQLVLLWGFAVGIGTGAIALVLGATIVNRWFVTNRGTVMGLLTAANATGQLVFLPLFAVLIAAYGWRVCSLAIGGFCALLIPVVLFVLRERPADLGIPPYGGTDIVVPVARVNPFVDAMSALRAGTRSRDFWLLAGTFFICGASTNGLIATHFVPACGDHGIPEVKAAGLLAAMGVFDLIGTTASGWLTDRYDSRVLLFMYYALRGLALLFLPTAFGVTTFGLPLFAILYGLDWIATVPPTLRLATDAFGRERAAIMFGWISAFHQFGAGLAAYGGGVIRTMTGSYDTAFFFAGGLCIVAAMLFLLPLKRRVAVA
jgi:MFS family permease